MVSKILILLNSTFESIATHETDYVYELTQYCLMMMMITVSMHLRVIYAIKLTQ